MVENKDRGKIPAQIVDICRNRIDEFSSLYYGSILFQVRFGNVYKVQTVNDVLIDKDKPPKEILMEKSKEELVELILHGKIEKKEGGKGNESNT